MSDEVSAERPMGSKGFHRGGIGAKVAELMRYHTSKSGDEMISFKVGSR